MRFQIKPYIFFFISNDGTHWKLWQEICGFHVFGGIKNWNSKVVFIETRGIRLRQRPSASTSIETPGFNETTFGFNFWTPKNVKPHISCQRFTETVIKKKKWGFLLKPRTSILASLLSFKHLYDPLSLKCKLMFYDDFANFYMTFILP